MSGTLIEVVKNSEQKSDLWQWDTGRQIKITPGENAIVDEVHFSNAYSKDALVVKPQVNTQGNIVADIPNILLWQVFPINIYVVMEFPNGKGTIYEEQLKINPRKKPSDYVYTETEILNYLDLEKRIKALEENGTGGGIAKETDPTVPAWAKQPQKPTYTADEVGAASKEVVSKLSEEITEIKENGTGTGSGATTAQANSLWAFLKKTAFTKPLTDAEINEFKTTWGITEEVEPDTPTTYTITRNLTNCTSSSEVTSISEGLAHTETITANNSYTLTGATVSVTMGDSDITSSYSNGVLNISSVTGNIVLTVSAVQETTEPDNPEVTLTSISATYTGGSVAVGTELTSLTGIAVTATYSDGSTATVTDYTLSGTIAEGSNTITVSYGGKTTTFTVIGVSSESTVTYYTITNNLTNVTTDNPLNTIAENSGYTAILTPDTDYEFDSVVVTMGGVDVTSDVYTDGAIVISAVTGNIVITASAVQPDNGELVFLDYVELSSGAYFDTGITANLKNKYLIGVMTPEITEAQYIWGTRARNHTSLDTSDYYDDTFVIKSALSASRYTKSTDHYFQMYDSKSMQGVNGSDNKSNLVPWYLYTKWDANCLEAYSDEAMTSPLGASEFISASMTSNYVKYALNTNQYGNEITLEPEKHAPSNVYLGKVNTTLGMDYISKYSVPVDGMKYYVYKVWSETDVLLMHLRPCKKGNKVGMYDVVSSTFFESPDGTVTAGSEVA